MAVITAVFLRTKHVIAHVRNAGGGSIINISSIYGLVGGGDIPCGVPKVAPAADLRAPR